MELPKIKSIISDPLHVPQKKGKVIKELPGGRFIPKEMQKMSGKGWKMITDIPMHNRVVELMEEQDKKGGAFLTHDDLELYMIGSCVLISDGLGFTYATKESPLEELTPEYWEKLSAQ